MNIPQTPKRFRNWLDKQEKTLPASVYDLGIIYWLSLCMIAMNRNNSDALATAKRISAANMQLFEAAVMNG